MDIRVVNLRDSDGLSDTRVVPFYEGINLSDSLEYLGLSIDAMVSHLVREEKFTGKYGEIESFRIPREKNPKNIYRCTHRYMFMCKITFNELKEALGKECKVCGKIRSEHCNHCVGRKLLIRVCKKEKKSMIIEV